MNDLLWYGSTLEIIKVICSEYQFKINFSVNMEVAMGLISGIVKFKFVKGLFNMVKNIVARNKTTTNTGMRY